MDNTAPCVEVKKRHERHFHACKVSTRNDGISTETKKKKRKKRRRGQPQLRTNTS